MRKRKGGDSRIFFPWEGRGGLRRTLGLGRMRPVLWIAVVLGFVAIVGVRERRRAGIRQTRATLLDTRDAIDRYLAEHDGGCPPSLTDVVPHGMFDQVPTDAWGRPLRLVCPSRHPGAAYDLMSDGPDGKPGGLDRIE